MSLDSELRLALLSFHPSLPGMWAFDRKRPSYASLCKLRRRGLAVCVRYGGSYRGMFGYRWYLTAAGEIARAKVSA